MHPTSRARENALFLYSKVLRKSVYSITFAKVDWTGLLISNNVKLVLNLLKDMFSWPRIILMLINGFLHSGLTCNGLLQNIHALSTLKIDPMKINLG